MQTAPRPVRRSLTDGRARVTLTAIGGALVGLALSPILALPLVPVAVVVALVGSWTAWHRGVAHQNAWRTVFVVTVAAVAAVVALFLVVGLSLAFTEMGTPEAGHLVG